MDQLAAIGFLGLLLVLLALAFLPREKPPRRPDWIGEFYDNHRRD